MFVLYRRSFPFPPWMMLCLSTFSSPLPLSQWHTLPCNGHTHCHTVTLSHTLHLFLFVPCRSLIAMHDTFLLRENNVRLHCVRPVIGVIVWKVQWQLDLKRAITSNPTTPLMASLSSSIVSTSPPTLSSPSFSANQCSWPHQHHRRTRTIPVDGKA